MFKIENTREQEKSIAEQIGENIRRSWKGGNLRNLTQQGLALRANISASHLSEILSGKKMPSPEVLSMIARALKVKECELLPKAWCGIDNNDCDIATEIQTIKRKVNQMAPFEKNKSHRALIELIKDLFE